MSLKDISAGAISAFLGAGPAATLSLRRIRIGSALNDSGKINRWGASVITKAYVITHAEAIKIATRKSDLFKVRQKDNEMLREFVSRFQTERMDLPPVTDDWVVQAFTQCLNTQSSIASQQPVDRVKKDVDQEPRSNRDRYQPYSGYWRNNEHGRNPVRNDRGHIFWGPMSKSGFDRDVGSKEAHRLSEYNFSIDTSGIVSAIGRIKDTRWPKPLQSDPAQRNPNQMCKYHGTHGHRIEDYRQLRDGVAHLFNEGHLQ
uniref:Uncharacterized protein LOC104227522 n=1 Tax=Nicotiana sylvestris TaxID=4096 RepID=A0A1U7WTR7_NICSY|nr:PREDICTED: uncharacterized protein LOC104227522 [Nicotiana sylvestris]